MEATGDNFECRAPQFYESLPIVDSNVLQDGADEFFDALSTPRTAKPLTKERVFTTGASSKDADNQPMPTTEPEVVGCSTEELTAVDRRRSVNDLPQGRLIRKAKRRSLQPKKYAVPEMEGEDDNRVRVALDRLFEGITLDKVEPDKEHAMLTRNDVKVKTPTLALRTRNIERLQLKRSRVLTPNSKEAVPVKFRAMTEQIMHYFQDTPPKFRTAPPNLDLKMPETNEKPLTVPDSTDILSKQRERSPVPQVQRSPEVTAGPSQPNDFKVPDAPQQSSKTTTKPLRLMAVATKVPENVHFKARPVPKASRRSMAVNPSSTAPVRAAVRPATRHGHVFVVGSNQTVSQKTVSDLVGILDATELNRVRSTKTKPKPFSFEMRDRAARQRKERKIQEAIENMTRVPKFTAQPLPAYLCCENDDESDASSTISMRSGRSTRAHYCDDLDKTAANFKAKPPTVLHQAPFIPKRSHKPLTDFTAFKLNTELRAKKRAEFEKAMKEQQEIVNEVNKERRAVVESIEKENLKQLRKNLVHKAKPVPAHILSARAETDQISTEKET